MKRFALVFLTLPLVPLWAADDLTPGLYEISTEMISSELPLPATTYTTTTCLSSENLEKDLSKTLAALPEGQECEAVNFELASGQARISIRCITPMGAMQLDSQGIYSADGYSLASTVSTELAGRELKINSKTTGKRIGDC
ncbi:MAG: DUF3617 family protein [Pseudomonadales bacterium]|nr:DUF3617 family protein [Pseudomonadales bacterium]